MILLKPYQTDAIESLSLKLDSLLKHQGTNKVCVFRSPTGSGKTVMVAKVIENLVNNFQEHDLCFLWVSIGKGELHVQSKKSLERIFGGNPKCSLVENDFLGNRKVIERNEVVVVNWEKIRSKDKASGEWKNKLMQAGEGFSLIEVLEYTRKERKIVLIIDESHYASDAARTKELREIISAEVTLEMSATPKLTITPEDTARGLAAFEMIEPSSVIEAGMIKKEIIINENLELLPAEEFSSQEIILEAAISKRNELQQGYADLNLEINPLCLIQLPNSEQGEAKKDAVLSYLRDRGITEENGKVALWFSEQKSDDLEYISEPDNPVEFLLFKQAIDTGWDCPRAQVLIKLRDIQSYTFEVQTLGRILRMPQQKHYENELLNVAYVYTNLSIIDVAKEEFNPNMVKHLHSKRKPIYKPLGLRSYHRSRIDYGDVTFSFQKVLEKTLCEVFEIPNETLVNVSENFSRVQKKIITDIKNLDDGIFTNLVLDTKDIEETKHISESLFEKQINVKLSSIDVYESFNALIKANLQGFAPKRSVPAVRQAIYVWFKKYLGLSLSNGGLIEIQKMFLHPQNLSFMGIALTKAIEAYIPIKHAEVLMKIEESHFDWDVKEFEYFNQHSVEKVSSARNIYEPTFLKIERSNPEKLFEEYLESRNDSVVWWYKNGEGKKDYFGLKYLEDDMPRTFYPDYIVQLENGRLLICDTKSGQTAKDSVLKARALENFFKHAKSDAFGGIAILDKSGKWRINQKPSESFSISDLQDWDYLDEFIG